MSKDKRWAARKAGITGATLANARFPQPPPMEKPQPDTTAFEGFAIGKKGIERLVTIPTHSVPTHSGSKLPAGYREAMEAARGMPNVYFDPTGAERTKTSPNSPRTDIDEEKLLHAIGAGKVDATIHEIIPGTDKVRITVNAHNEQTMRKLLAEVKQPERPTIADALRATPPDHQIIAPKEAMRIHSRLLAAPRFMLDAPGWTTLYDFIDRCPDLIAEQQQFALPPYDTMWVEWSLPEHRRGWSRDHTARCEGVGFLIDDGEVNPVLLTRYEDVGYEATIMPVSYKLHRPYPAEEFALFLQQNTFTVADLDRMIWGDGLGRDLARLKPKHREAVRQQHTIYFERHGIDRILEKADARTLVRLLVEGANGDLCDILAFLLMVNQPGSLVRLRNEPAGRRFVSGKLRPYMSHSKITLHIGSHVQIRRRLRRLQKVERGVVAQHDVRAHFCHDHVYHQNKGCVHQLKAYNWMTNKTDEDPPRHWVCEVCMGKRWHFRKCTRGSAKVGFHSHDYDVTR